MHRIGSGHRQRGRETTLVLHDADRRAGVRIFDEPPGLFNLNTSTIVASSGTWDTDKGFADDYIRKMGHGYGNGFWGEPMADVLVVGLGSIGSRVARLASGLGMRVSGMRRRLDQAPLPGVSPKVLK